MTGAAESINEPAMRLPNTIALNFVFIETPVNCFCLELIERDHFINVTDLESACRSPYLRR